MALMIALDASPRTRPIAVLLGPEVKPEPALEESLPASSGETD